MINEEVKEVIFVGLPGPTHNYGGLSPDNVAATANRGSRSSPRQAALQALELARRMQSLGVEVGLFPPQLRPHLATLKQYFTGNPETLLAEAAAKNPALLEKMCSSSAMWAANAATSSPAIDNRDSMLHITAANLHTNLHRRIEADDTHRVLRAIFANVPGCQMHPPLPAATGMRDEGAANHMRLAPYHNRPALNVFVYGTDGSPGDPESARQTLSASQAVAAQHSMRDALFVKQNPAVIRQGVFHNDVIAVSNESVLLVHEQAYAGGQADIDRIADTYRALQDEPLTVIVVRDSDLSVEEAVKTYFFNSQIITREGGRMAIIAPTEVATLYGGKASKLMQSIVADKGNPIEEMHFVDLRQSMSNGGGPACLRLRLPMARGRIEAIRNHVNVLATDKLLEHVETIVRTHYPEELNASDLTNPELYYRCRTVLMEMGALMNLPLLPES